MTEPRSTRTSLPAQSAASLFALRPLVVGALHLPDLAVAAQTSMAQLEDYLLANAAVFADGGVPGLMLQDETRVPAEATPEVVAIMGSLGRLLRTTLPQLQIGIIVQAHDPAAALAVAHAVGAGFVRIKVFVGGVMAFDGPRNALGVRARLYRHQLRRDDIAILADVHDRTSMPRDGVPHDEAALWAEQIGADGLILTGSSFSDTLERIDRARAAGVKAPILIGGGVTAENVGQSLARANGVIVSRAMMALNAGPGDLVRWDLDKTRRFMDAANRAGGTGTA